MKRFVPLTGERLQHWLEDAHGWPRGHLSLDSSRLRDMPNLSGMKHPFLDLIRPRPAFTGASLTIDPPLDLRTALPEKS